MRETGLEPMENSLISGLSFSIRLGMCDEGESMLDVELIQKLFEPLTVELSAVISDDHSRETIPTYYGLSGERFNLKFGDVGHGLGLHLFGEIVHRDKEKLSL